MDNLQALTAAGLVPTTVDHVNFYGKDISGGRHVEIADSDEEFLSFPLTSGPVFVQIFSCTIADMNDPESAYNTVTDIRTLRLHAEEYPDAAAAIAYLEAYGYIVGARPR